MAISPLIRYIRALDSSVTTGAGKTGLAYTDFTAKYLVDGGTLTSLTTETITTLGTYQAPSDAAHIRIKEVSSSDPCKGTYEVHFHNTQLAAGAKLWLFLSATGAAIQPLEMDTVPAVPQGRGKTYYVAPTATGTMTLSSPSATFFFSARSTGTAASTEGNGTKTIVTVQSSSEGTAYNTSTDVLTVTVNISGGHNTVQHLINAINAGTHFTAFQSTGAGSTITTSTTGSGTLSGGVDCSDAYSGLTSITPFASIGAANTAVVAGDTIHLNSGNHSDDGTNPFVTISKNKITIEGDSRNLVTVYCAGFDSGIWSTGDEFTVRHLAVNSSNDGSLGIKATGKGLWLHDCSVTAVEGPLDAQGDSARVTNCLFTAGRYGCKFSGHNWLLENSFAQTTATFTYEANSNFAAIYSTKEGTIRNCNAIALSIAASSSGKLVGLCTNAAPVLVENLNITVANVSATQTGGCYGIVNFTGGASVAKLNGGTITVSNSGGTGATTDIDASVSGSFVSLSGTQTDPTKWTGASNIYNVENALMGAQAEPGQGAPAVNANPITKLAYLYKFLRNKKTQTASQFSVYADDASTVDHKATCSDDLTTTTVGEIATGP